MRTRKSPKKRVLGINKPAQAQPVVSVVTRKNHFAICLDRSSSMSYLKTPTIKAYNEIVAAIQAAAALHGQPTTISLYTFGSSAMRETHLQDAAYAQLLSPQTYNPNGNTALFDAVGMAIDDFEKLPVVKGIDEAFVVIAVTDGEENNSRFFRGPQGGGYHGTYYGDNRRSIVELMARVQGTDRYTITFQMPPGKGRAFAQGFGIPVDNIREWEQTEAGVTELSHVTRNSTASFYEARERGATMTKAFYVQPDLSKLKKVELQKLDNVQAQFKSWTVDKEADVKAFVESHGKKYVLGSVFYALTKKEKVQPQKKVLVQEKGSKAVYGGVQARGLIGLPDGQHAIVEPGNHGNYDIYVQSTSINRKLVRGTKVLFDTNLSVDLPPTWDHEAAKKAADAKKGVTF